MPSSRQVRPDYEAKGELGLGEALLFKAIGEATGRTIKDIKAEYVQVGDLGEVAQTSRGKQSTLFKPKPLTVNIVYDTLKKVADVSGTQVRGRISFPFFFFFSGTTTDFDLPAPLSRKPRKSGLSRNCSLIVLASKRSSSFAVLKENFVLVSPREQ